MKYVATSIYLNLYVWSMWEANLLVSILQFVYFENKFSVILYISRQITKIFFEALICDESTMYAIDFLTFSVTILFVNLFRKWGDGTLFRWTITAPPAWANQNSVHGFMTFIKS